MTEGEKKGGRGSEAEKAVGRDLSSNCSLPNMGKFWAGQDQN